MSLKIKIFLFSFTFLLSFSNLIGQDLSKNDLIDELLVITKAKKTTEVIINGIIAKYKEKYPSLPTKTWEEIQKNIDYSAYMNQVRDAYYQAYTKAELISLIKYYKDGATEQYKEGSKRIYTSLYNIGSDFGKSVMIMINKKVDKNN